MFGIAFPLNRLLQTEDLDLSTEMFITTNIEDILLKMRNDSEKKFYYIFKTVKITCSNWNVDVKIQRKVGR
jgi:hypothetical protein